MSLDSSEEEVRLGGIDFYRDLLQTVSNARDRIVLIVRDEVQKTHALGVIKDFGKSDLVRVEIDKS